MMLSLTTSLTLHGVTIADFPVKVHYRMPAWTDEVPFGLADEPIVDEVSFPYLPDVDIDLTPIYDRHPKLMRTLVDQIAYKMARGELA